MTPLSKLTPRQSLGFIEAGQQLFCKADIAQGDLTIFKAGQSYMATPFPITVRRTVKRPAVSGPPHEHVLTGRDIAISLLDYTGHDKSFVDARHCADGMEIVGVRDQIQFPLRPHFTTDVLVEHFEIPVPMDVSLVHPEQYARNIRFLEDMEKICDNGFAWKQFQKEDLASLALTDGCVFSGDCGIGKTPMTIGWALLKTGLHPQHGERLFPSAPVLIICPGGLAVQMIAEYTNLFGPAFPGITRIRNQDQFSQMLLEHGGRLAPGFYLSSYTEIALNKWQMLPKIPDGDLPDNVARSYLNFFKASTLDECRRLAREQPENFSKPSLAQLACNSFSAIALDEGVRIKSDDSIIGAGVRSMNAKHRIVLSGTVVKNTLPDFHLLGAWASNALDKPTDQWPYPASSAAKFSEDFLVTAHNRTLEMRTLLRPGAILSTRKSFSRQRRGIPTASISNNSKLWKVLAPVVLRRRKADIGADQIPPKIYRPVIVPFGKEQARIYQHHLNRMDYDRRGQLDIISKIATLRMICAAPGAESIFKVRSEKPFTPKVHACMEIIRGVLQRREQVIIFAPFHEPLDVLDGFLQQADVPHDVLDGRMPIGKRAQLAMDFKRGLPQANPVLLGGMRAMSEGFSFHLCSNVIIYADDFALDLRRQAEDRAHRLNSPKPVNIFSITVANSIERKMHAMQEEKGAAADIALDGAPGAFQTEEMLQEDIFQIATTEFSEDGLIDEDVCMAAWPALCRDLRNAWSGQQMRIVGSGLL